MASRSPTRTAARGMTVSEVLALPVMVSLESSNRALSLGRTLGYAMAKRGEYPIPVSRVGGAYRCRRADLLDYLGVTTRAAA